MPSSAPLPAGTLLENRYNVVRFIGHGGFGRTYLVSDQHRFNEHCVLKEFAPQVSQPTVLQKAEELFQREAGTLYKLRHPQIPEFRALSSVQYKGEPVLFLVEQFIDGDNYGEWLANGHCLSAAQGLQLLQDLLPVLSYIHRQGVIHRDISPDNLMCDRHTGKPILIDFGSVKRVTETALRLVGSAFPVTQIRKLGYTPHEQMQGDVYPSSDLYALAVTLLVLMTGSAPTDLCDAKSNEWYWQPLLKLPSRFDNILRRMLARHPHDRYQSADAVLQAIGDLSLGPSQPLPATLISQSSPTIPPVNVAASIDPKNLASSRSPSAASPITANQVLSSVKTVAVAPAWQPPPPTERPRSAQHPAAVGYAAHSPNPPVYHPTPDHVAIAQQQPDMAPRSNDIFLWKLLWGTLLLPLRLLKWTLKLLWGTVCFLNMMFNWIVRLIMLVILLGGAAIAMMFFQPDWWSSFSFPSIPNISKQSHSSQGCQNLEGRATRVGMSYADLNQQVNAQFYQRYPQMRGRSLTDSAADQQFRDAWCDIADRIVQRAER
jgi:serine/threonine-protein kinase